MDSENKKRTIAAFVYYTGLTQEQLNAFLSFLLPFQDNTLQFEPQKSLSIKNLKIEDQVL